MAHGVLGEDHGEPGLDQDRGQVAGAGDGDHGVVGAVLEQHGDRGGRLGVDLQHAGRHERAHRQDARRARAVTRPEGQRQRQPAALGEPADHRLGPGHPLFLAGGVEQVVDRGQCLGEPGTRVGGHVVPGEPRRRGHRAARQHGGETTLRVEVAEQATQVALVGAVAVQQQQEAVGLAPAHDVGDQFHRDSSVGWGTVVRVRTCS